MRTCSSCQILIFEDFESSDKIGTEIYVYIQVQSSLWLTGKKKSSVAEKTRLSSLDFRPFHPISFILDPMQMFSQRQNLHNSQNTFQFRLYEAFYHFPDIILQNFLPFIPQFFFFFLLLIFYFFKYFQFFLWKIIGED